MERRHRAYLYPPVTIFVFGHLLVASENILVTRVVFWGRAFSIRTPRVCSLRPGSPPIPAFASSRRKLGSRQRCPVTVYPLAAVELSMQKEKYTICPTQSNLEPRWRSHRNSCQTEHRSRLNCRPTNGPRGLRTGALD